MSRNDPAFGDVFDRPVCPNGHTAWTRSNGHYWCHDCSRLHGANPEFDSLRDPETGDRIDPIEVNAS